MSRLDEPLPYYKWLWRDYRANRKVQNMNYIERGLYRELLDECWAEGSIPDDVEELAEICGCPADVMANAWPKLSKCFLLSDGVWINEKLDSLRTASDSARVARANSGKKGGLARSKASNGAEPDSTSQANAKQMPSTCHIAEQSRADTEHEQSRADEEQIDRLSPAKVVFDRWREVMKSPRSAFDAKRKRVIEARLKDGYTVDELCNAVAGCSLSSFHMGENENGTKYNGLDLIMRNSEKVDQFIGFYNNPPRPSNGQRKPTQIERRAATYAELTGRSSTGEKDNGRVIDVTPTTATTEKGADPVD